LISQFLRLQNLNIIRKNQEIVDEALVWCQVVCKYSLFYNCLSPNLIFVVRQNPHHNPLNGTSLWPPRQNRLGGHTNIPSRPFRGPYAWPTNFTFPQGPTLPSLTLPIALNPKFGSPAYPLHGTVGGLSPGLPRPFCLGGPPYAPSRLIRGPSPGLPNFTFPPSPNAESPAHPVVLKKLHKY